ncbi:MAG: hypothetical protein U0Q15_19660 [Kineosporiaceae bacterium]
MPPSPASVLTAPPTLSVTPVTPAPRPAPSAVAEAYVVSTHKVRDRAAGLPLVWQPYGVQHAWLPGSRRTLCGQVMTGWTVFWERRFAPNLAAACPDCAEASLPATSRSRLDPRGH